MLDNNSTTAASREDCLTTQWWWEYKQSIEFRTNMSSDSRTLNKIVKTKITQRGIYDDASIFIQGWSIRRSEFFLKENRNDQMIGINPRKTRGCEHTFKSGFTNSTETVAR